MTKYIKLFEDFNSSLDQDKAAESIYEQWRSNISNSFFDSLTLLENEDLSLIDINENDDFWDEEGRELSSGEKRAIARDMQVMTREQLGALYLRALGASQGEPGKYLVMVPNIAGFGEILKDGEFKITAPGLADAIGLESFATISRTTKKLQNLIDGIGETVSEVIYPKVLDAYEFFKTQDPKNIASMISVNNPAEYTLNRDKAAEYSTRASELAKERKANISKIGQNIYSLFLSLKTSGLPKFSSTKSALEFALNKIATENDISQDRLREIYKKFLASKGLSGSAYYA
jgi:hypothetical protein